MATPLRTRASQLPFFYFHNPSSSRAPAAAAAPSILSRSRGSISTPSHSHTSLTPSLNTQPTASFSTTPTTVFPRKHSQDRTTLDPTSTEGTRSGTDADVASKSAAYEPTSTAPETELCNARKEAAENADDPVTQPDVDDAGDTGGGFGQPDGKGQEVRNKQEKKLGNPLEVSGANREVSSTAGSEGREGKGKGVERGPSKRESPRKGKKLR